MINPWVIVGLILFWLASLLGAEQYGAHARGVKDDLKAAQLQLAEDRLINDARNANDALISRLEVKKNEANTVIDYLANSKPSGSLRLPKSACPSQIQPSTGGEPAITGNGVLPTDAQIAFGEFTKGLDELAYRADQVVEECRVIQEWAKAQQ